MAWEILVIRFAQDLICFQFENSLAIVIAAVFNVGLIFWT